VDAGNIDKIRSKGWRLAAAGHKRPAT